MSGTNKAPGPSRGSVCVWGACLQDSSQEADNSVLAFTFSLCVTSKGARGESLGPS